jgi:hypothetical protein
MTLTTTTAATPKKLKDGSWGALAQSENVTAGDTLQVTAKSGKSWGSTVSKVLWAGDGKAICTTDSGKPSPGGGYGNCADCGKPLSYFDYTSSPVKSLHFDCA